MGMKNPVRTVCGHPARLVLATGLVLLASVAARAQGPGLLHTGPVGGIGRGSVGLNDKVVPEAKVRTVQGTVVDAKGTAIKGAMVYLKNDRTAKVQTITVDPDGKYRFMGVSRTDDYKLWAAAGEKKTPEKVISSFDNTVEVKRDLHVE